MKLQVTQENLNKALGTVARVANTKNALPILSNILIKTTAKGLYIAATNLNIAITETIGAKVDEKGSITVPARLLQDFVSNLPAGVVDVAATENKLNISTNQYQSTINGIAADEFPVMPRIKDGSKLELSSSDLKKALQQVIFAASTDDSRPVLTGIYIHTNQGKLYCASTDSYRLAEKLLPSPSPAATSLLVPASAMQDLLRIVSSSDESVEVTYDEQQARFVCGGTELIARQVDGNYPDYKKLIPSKFQTIAVVKRDEFINITKVSSLFARESAGSITIKMDTKDSTISIHSIASQLGENTSTAEAQINNDGAITLNSRYLLDALQAFDGDNIELCINGKLDPCVLRDPKQSDYLHVIMPVKS